MAHVLDPLPPNGAAVLLIHSWWGCTAPFLDYGAALARAGFTVAVADLFDGATARTETDARALRARPRRIPMYRTLAADLAALRARFANPSARIGIVGFSMGGHWAVWLAQRPEYDISATVLYYAARGGDYSRSPSRFVAHFAQTDPWVSASSRRGMETAIRRAGRTLETHDYPGTGHWFAESDRAADHHPPAAALAWQRSLAFLTETLTP